MVEIIEARPVDIDEEPQRAVVPVQPGQAIVSEGPDGPEAMLIRATAIATALSRMVEQQKLFTVISGKKYPHVEAWLTIGRMDNVVAREAQPPVRNEDGSWEAEVELVRLSDGMVIGRASALCGTKDDVAGRNDWSKRAEPQKRSMAVTRATSRAFRLQYSWIMALAGYEPTPREEMDGGDDRHEGQAAVGERYSGAANRTTHHDGLVGKAIAQGSQDYELRLRPDDNEYTLPFRLKEGKLSQIVLAKGELALQLADVKDTVLGERLTVWGHYTDETFTKGGEDIVYKVLHAERVRLPDGSDLPRAADVIPIAPGQEPMFDATEQAALDEAIGA